MLCQQRWRGQWEQGSKLFHVSFYFWALIVPQAPREAGHPVIRARVLSIKRKTQCGTSNIPRILRTGNEHGPHKLKRKASKLRAWQSPRWMCYCGNTKGTPNLGGRRGWREWWPRREAGERASSEIWSDSGSWLGAEVNAEGWWGAFRDHLKESAVIVTGVRSHWGALHGTAFACWSENNSFGSNYFWVPVD